jgi:hypothetical protein
MTLMNFSSNFMGAASGQVATGIRVVDESAPPTPPAPPPLRRLRPVVPFGAMMSNEIENES